MCFVGVSFELVHFVVVLVVTVNFVEVHLWCFGSWRVYFDDVPFVVLCYVATRFGGGLFCSSGWVCSFDEKKQEVKMLVTRAH